MLTTNNFNLKTKINLDRIKHKVKIPQMLRLKHFLYNQQQNMQISYANEEVDMY